MYNKINVVRHQEERECPLCGKIWTIWARKLSRDCKYRFCKECIEKTTPNQRRAIKKEKFPKFKDHINELKRNSYKKNIASYMLKRAQQRAIKYGYEFNLELEDIIIPDICPILEVPLVLGEKDNYEYTPSIDRIDNSKGYIKGNIQIISKKANSMKNSASLEELQKFCKNVLRYSLTSSE